MKPSRARRSVFDTLLEKGIIAVAIGLTLLVAPHVLSRGTPLVNTVTAALQAPGWAALGLGLMLIALHLLVLYLRRNQSAREVEDAPVSRFQHSVLPDELLYPPTRIRLEPIRPPRQTKAPEPPPDPAPESVDPYPTESGELSTMPAELDAQDTAPVSLQPMPAEPSLIWGPEVLTQIEWRRFEALCTALMAQAGFRTRVESQGPDGGLLVWLHSRHVQGPAAVVHCRHWLHKAVGLRELREFQKLMDAHQIRRGTCITSGRYTRDALDFAQARRINVLDGPALLELIGRRRPEQQQALLDAAYEGEYWRPTCAHCGTKMVERIASRHGTTFWGCTDYPRCRNTLRVPAAATT